MGVFPHTRPYREPVSFTDEVWQYMMRSRTFIALFLIAVGAVACSGGTVTVVPHGKASSGPGSRTSATPTPSPAPSPSSSGSLLPDAVVSAAVSSVGSYYATLPHTNLTSDLQSLANNMVSSGQFKSAIVSPGGITATLSDGEVTLVYADAPEDFSATTSSAARVQSVRKPQYAQSFVGPPAPHSYVFLYDDVSASATGPDFHPLIDAAWGHQLQDASFTNPTTNQAVPNYSVTAESATLSAIASLGSQNYGLDYLSISTHGMVANIAPPATASAAPQYQYYLQSTSPISLRSQYSADIGTKNIALAVNLVNSSGPTTFPVTLAFSPTWLVSHVQFNPGAVVTLDSCFGASPYVLGNNGVVFLNAKVGRFYAWTKAVGIIDDYETWSFAFDRLIGEQSPSIGDLYQVANQHTPPQRPFSLDDIYTAMQSETRNSPIQPPKAEPYSVSDVNFAPNAAFPPASDGTAARLIETDFGYENLAGAPAIYAMPSIGTMSVAESPAGGTLTINGRFPPDPGGVGITDGTGQHPLTVTSWTTKQVVATIPSIGAGSAGAVTVSSTSDLAGIASNPAPLTQWSGAVTYSESDDVANLGGVNGTGGLTATATFNITFRSDVHPTVQTIDATPVPQNLYFSNVEGNASDAGSSNAAITQLQGNFISSEGTPPPATASLSLSSVANMSPQNLNSSGGVAAGSFIVGAIGGQPAPCNNASPGPEGDSGIIFCPAFGYHPTGVGICSADADDSNLCAGEETFSPAGSFGAGSLLDPGIVTFAMDPSSYGITVNGPNTMFTRNFGESAWQANATVTGTIDAPLFAPTTTTPASIRRR